MKIIGIIFIMIFIVILGTLFGYYLKAKSAKVLTAAEKRVIVHHLTKAAEQSRMDTSTLRQVGFEQPSVVDYASDLDALSNKIKSL